MKQIRNIAIVSVCIVASMLMVGCEDSDSSAPAPENVAGTWIITTQRGSTGNWTMDLNQSGETISGSLHMHFEETSLTANVSGTYRNGMIAFELSASWMVGTDNWTGTVSGNSMSGQRIVVGNMSESDGTSSWSATKQ